MAVPSVWKRSRSSRIKKPRTHGWRERSNAAVVRYALVDKHYSTTRSRYLLCSTNERKACAGPGTIYTDEFEQIIYDEMAKKNWRNSENSGSVKGIALTLRINYVEHIQLTQAESEIAALMERLSVADDTMFRYISGRIKELDGKKQELMKRIFVT